MKRILMVLLGLIFVAGMSGLVAGNSHADELNKPSGSAFKKGDVIEVVDPHMDMHRYGTVAEVYKGVAYGIMFPGEEEVHRWYVDFELKPATGEDLKKFMEQMEGMEKSKGHGH